MRFYNKIFIAFFGLLMMATRDAIGAGIGGNIVLPDPINVILPVIPWPPERTDLPANVDYYPCAANAYIAKCDFSWPVDDDDPTTPVTYVTFTGVDITPESIFAFVAATTGYLCWDFDEPKNNYNNLHILFGNDENAVLECYSGQQGSAEEKLYIIRSNQKPLTTKVKVPYNADPGDINNLNYKIVADSLKRACDGDSVYDPDNTYTYCTLCPNKNSKTGYSNQAYFRVHQHEGDPTIHLLEWKSFPTIADCFYWDNGAPDYTHEDNTGTFKYIGAPNNGACYYSGE